MLQDFGGEVADAALMGVRVVRGGWVEELAHAIGVVTHAAPADISRRIRIAARSREHCYGV